MQYDLSVITEDHTIGLSDAREYFLPAGYRKTLYSTPVISLQG
jgi:hypothetical protein